MKLSDIMVFDAIVPELQATTRDESIAELIQALAAAKAIPKTKVKEVTKVVLQREEQATTGIGKGVALPHAKLKGIKKPIATSTPSAPPSSILYTVRPRRLLENSCPPITTFQRVLKMPT